MMRFGFLIMTTFTMSFSSIVNGAASDYAAAIEKLNKAPASIKKTMSEAPRVYEFEGIEGGSGVAYSGQTFRLVLINNLKKYMTSMDKGEYQGSTSQALRALNSYYDFKLEKTSSTSGVIHGESRHRVSGKTITGETLRIKEGRFYSDLTNSEKNLKDKIAGIDNDLRRGVLKGISDSSIRTPDDLVKKWFSAYANSVARGDSFVVPNGSLDPQVVKAGHVSPEGLDYAQLVQKFFHGAISYSQAAMDYLSTDLGPNKGFNADNTKPYKGTSNYTALAHFFDEGFGYFGASRNFLTLNKSEVSSAAGVDFNNDEKLSINSEMQLGIAANSARVDRQAKDKRSNLKNEAITAFLKARHLITKKPVGYKDYAIANARVALGAWEKTFAAVTIIYINKVLGAYEDYGTTDFLFTNFAKFWGEMKGFGLAFQFSPTSIMKDSDFDTIHRLMKDAPVLPWKNGVNNYKRDLRKIRDILRTTYGFSKVNSENW